MLQTILDAWRAVHRLALGPPKSPHAARTRESLLLVAFLAWVGLGADGLSSANYGPEAAYLALGEHSGLSLYIAIATAVTVFVIGLGYNQAIALFPTGGGGYRVATRLIGPRAGLVSGAALIVDYVLTIAISVAAGVDAVFSLLPVELQGLKLPSELLLIGLLIMLNLRGVKESILVLMPIFLGFLVTHLVLIAYGVGAHADHLPNLVVATARDTWSLAGQMGWVFVLSVLLRAYSLGGGTYTGIEAVSNNVQRLAEPRVENGRLTMFYMATSLAVVAGGIILLYLLWDVRARTGQTLNAVVFRTIIDSWQMRSSALGSSLLALVLLSEAGLLFVAANTGFLGGPPVLSNMAGDDWVPHQFGHLSSRLVTQNGVLLMGLSALGILWWTGGEVSVLVVLYSINVFITFTLTLLGLSVFWVRNRRRYARWRKRLALSAVGFAICGGILAVTLIEKFAEGGWVTLLITGGMIALCFAIRRHYDDTRRQLEKADELFLQTTRLPAEPPTPLPLDHTKPTAVFLVGDSIGTGIHTMLWVRRLFPSHFANHVFMRVGEIDAHSYDGAEAVKVLRAQVERSLAYFVGYSIGEGVPATSYTSYGIDVIGELTRLAERVRADFPNCVFFSSKLIFQRDTWFTRLLHNQTAIAVQRHLHFHGMQMMVLPMRVT